jgi:MoaA/NifB/PqqE/SkfB family radical SAM enzyme
MTVLMDDTCAGLEELLRQSADARVSHYVTLVSRTGFRRGSAAGLPAPGLTDELHRLRRAYPHLRVFRDYVDGMDAFLAGGELPACRAGEQSFNVDHAGNVSVCIEKLDQVAGNIRDEPLGDILARLRAAAPATGCQACWTLCRGTAQSLGSGATARSWFDLLGMRA